MKPTIWSSPLGRCINPTKWNLTCRFFFTTGLLLVCGAILTILIFGYKLKQTTVEAINNRLNDYSHLVAQQQRELLTSLNTAAAAMSVNDEITSAIEDNNRLGLQISVAAINNKKLLSSGRKPAALQFFTAEIEPLFHSRGLNKLGDPLRKSFDIIKKTKQVNSAVSGAQLLHSGPTLAATIPAVRNGQLVGFVEASATFEELFSFIKSPNNFGFAILIDQKQKKKNQTPAVTKKNVTTFGVTDINGYFRNTPSTPGTIGSFADSYFKTTPLLDYNNNEIGRLILFYKGTVEQEDLYATLKALGWMTLIGITVICLSLYFNLSRILSFLKQLNRTITYSISNDYRASFLVQGTSCCDVFNCTDDECPVGKYPGKVCYHEVGNKAIKPSARNTCPYLQKYHVCKECPVFMARRGDELDDIRHATNSLMSIWGDFLTSAGSMFSGVFRNSGDAVPNLDDVGLYLEQMAGLSSFGHDMQGVYSKEEVYSQLQWVFEKQFGLSQFNLLEVNSSENRMQSVISLTDLSSSHMDVFVNCELCRTKRVAEPVTSEKNPHLCPYFDIDHEQEVRCCLPMVMGGRVGAVFTFVTPRIKWEENKKDLPIITKYLDETAPTLASLRLLQISREQALRDPLTKCHNRRFMDEYLVQLEGLNSRTPRNVGFVMADLDHFKMVNDEFGHLAGDEILKQLAEILRKNIRKSDLLIRYGGEEFLIILMDINIDGAAMQIAEKLRAAVEEAKLSLPTGGSINKTISMGVAEFPNDAEYLYKAIKYADVALYQAKEQGRNKVLRFQTEMWKEDEY